MKMEFRISFIFSCVVLSFITHVFGCDNSNCLASDDTICNGQGICDCGVCTCNGSYTGPTCEECPTCPTACEIYRDCVRCKIFGTGPLGPMECIFQCGFISKFRLVDKSEFDNPADDDDRIVCNTLNDKYCMEWFKIGGMREGYRESIVRTEEDCNVKYRPTNPPEITVTLETVKNGETGPRQESEDGSQRKLEDVAAVSGSNQGQKVGDNGAETQTLSRILSLVVIVLSLVL